MLLPPLGQAYRRFERNILRVRNLVIIYESQATGKGRRAVDSTDTLRAAVVLLHAALEDLLRGVAAYALPRADRDVLDKIPLVGLGERGQAEKFLLGALHAHVGKRVRDLIEESVQSYLDRKSFSNTEDIATLLRSCRIDSGKCNNHFSTLQALMKRRHHIVHRADANEGKGSGQHGAKSISKAVVRHWIQAVEDFGSTLKQQLEV